MQSSSIDYSVKEASHPSYRQSRVLPINQASQNLNASATTETQIELPNKVFNFAKSSLDFEVYIPGGSSAFTCLHKLGTNMIDRISVYTREGTFLADLTQAFEYTRAVLPYTTPMDKFLELDSNLGLATDAAADKGGNFCRSNVPVPSSTPAVALGYSGTRVTPSGITGVYAAPSIGSTEPMYFSQTVIDAGANQGDIYLKFSVPLSTFKHTILAMDKDIYFGQGLQMRVHWNSVNRIGWMGTSATVPATGLIAISTTVAVSNIRLQLAVEVDQEISNQLMNKVNSSGMKLLIPYVVSNNFTSSSGTSSNVQYRYNLSSGQRLLNIYHCLFSNVNTGPLAVDISNLADAKIVSYQTQLNSQYLQENVLICADQEDYVLMRPLLEGSVIQNCNISKHNKVHIDSWRSGKCIDWEYADSNQVKDGIELSQEQIWAWSGTTASAAYRQLTFAVVQKEVQIMPNGSVLVV